MPSSCPSAYAVMMFSVAAEEHTPAYRSMPASRNRRPSAFATPTRPGVPRRAAASGGGVGHHGRVPGIYDEPEFYEAACAYRDVPSEVDALLRWFGQHHGADPALPGAVLELAAGPAEHARNLASRGLDVTALDLNPAMCARAADLADKAGLKLTVVQADMRDFRLPGRYDLAITMLNSLCHLFSLDDMVRH